MGKINYVLILFFTFIILSCEAVNENNVLVKLDCNNLKTGIIKMNSEIVKLEINKLVIDLDPLKTDEDIIGHKENIYLLIKRLNTYCKDIKAELICYACIETNPPQSEILVVIDSIGVLVKRVVDISTPSDANLSCVRIHEYYHE